MKNTIYFLILICSLASCKDDFYAEGYIKTIGITELTNQSAILNGSIKIVTAGDNANLKIARRGFVFGITANELTAVKYNLNGMVYDHIASEGYYSGNINGLSPNTKYYARAFFVLVHTDINGRIAYLTNEERLVYLHDDFRSYSNVNVFYGNIIEFTTKK